MHQQPNFPKRSLSDNSAQPCGCDAGANYTCERHTCPDPGDANDCKVVEYAMNLTAPTRASTLPTNPKYRKEFPVASGVLDYFPDALVAVAHVSWVGNQQHNPGQPLHWARGKSMDQDDTLIRHFLERGTKDTDGLRHTAKMAWRALAMLQLEIERERT